MNPKTNNTLGSLAHLKKAIKMTNNSSSFLDVESEFTSCIYHMNKKIELNPEDTQLLINISIAYRIYGSWQLERAKALMDDLVETEPNNADAYFELSLIHDHYKEHKEELNYLKKAIKLKKGDVDILCNLAGAYMSNGEAKKGIKLLNDKLESTEISDDERIRIYSSLEYIYDTQGEYEMVEECGKKAFMYWKKIN